MLAGLGPDKGVTPESLRLAAAAAMRAALAARAGSVAVTLPAAAGGLDARARGLAVLEALALAGYRFDRHITDARRKPAGPRRVVLCAGDEARAVAAVRERAAAVAEASALARDLVNMPPNEMYPESFVAEARRAARGRGVRLEVFDPARLARERMGALLAVARGSVRPPRVLHAAYRPAGRAKARVVFVGKGVTFDSGGYDIKTTDSMGTMKCDMAGAAAAYAATLALARLRAPVEVHAVLGLVENLVSGDAYKPGDVLTTRSGKTVEINNTDAEGRLVLADLLDWSAQRLRPDAMVDLATLTGACVVALGPLSTGVFTPDDALAEALLAAARRAGEKMWRLPMYGEYRDQLKSDVADMTNSGQRWGGAITAALFLQSFVKDGVPWAHLDIAGPAFLSSEHAFWGKGGTGAGVATLVDYALAL